MHHSLVAEVDKLSKDKQQVDISDCLTYDSYSSILGVLHLRERNKDLEEGEVRSKDRVEVINM